MERDTPMNKKNWLARPTRKREKRRPIFATGWSMSVFNFEYLIG